MSAVLQEALSYARSDAQKKGRSIYRPTVSRSITRRGILWLGLTCNLHCQFCYFRDRVEDVGHPQHPFMSLSKAKKICRTLVDYYGNNSIDIQGGEPTIYPEIYELVSFCTEIGLSPTLITNAVELSDPAKVARFKKAGIRDFLVSIQGLGQVHDRIVGRKGAHLSQMKALRNLQQYEIPFRINTVLSREALPQLQDISRLAVLTGAGVVNFLGFNPFNDQQTGKRCAGNVPRYSEIRAPLEMALDYLTAERVEVNVRYLPICTVSESHRPNAYGFRQLPYDLHENDFASWSWTDLPAQRTASAALTPPLGLGPRLKLGLVRRHLRELDRRHQGLGNRLHRIKQHLEQSWAKREGNGYKGASAERLYQNDAVMRAREYAGYRHIRACRRCSLRLICDGIHNDYAKLFSAEEIRPVHSGFRVSDPQYYTRGQYKVIHPLDREWLEGKNSAQAHGNEGNKTGASQ